MEEIQPDYLGKSVGDFCTDMYHKVDKNNPVTGWVNGVRIIMFVEEQIVDPHYDGPRK